MIEFEYKVEPLCGKINKDFEMLSTVGAGGWEAVCKLSETVYSEDRWYKHKHEVMLLKRKVRDY